MYKPFLIDEEQESGHFWSTLMTMLPNVQASGAAQVLQHQTQWNLMGRAEAGEALTHGNHETVVRGTRDKKNPRSGVVRM